MAKVNEDWRVLRHGPIDRLGSNLWSVTGTLPGFIFRHITGSTGGPRVTRLYRMMAVKDKPALRAHLERLAETPDLKRILVSHHIAVTDEPADVLRRVAAAL